MFTRPRPDTTPSTSARPTRWIRARSTSMSRSFRAAKSAWPPSDGDGTKRPSTWCSNASPRPVPAAISAMLPPRSASPLLKRVQLGSAAAPAPRRPWPADRSSSDARPMSNVRATAARRPATARWSAARCRRSPGRPRRSTPRRAPRPCTAGSLVNAGDHRRQIGEVERRERANDDRFGRAGRGSNSPRSVLVPPMSPARSMRCSLWN